MIGIASSCGLAAEAGARIADRGGNAVDAALAASAVAAVTEPGVCSLGGGAFVTIWAPGEQPVVVDGHVEMPGRGLPPDRLGGGRIDVWMEYGRGVSTIVGPGSVATPGLLACFQRASDLYGALPWAELLEPAYDYAQDGFPLSQPSYDYLVYSADPVFGWDPPSRAALHDADGAGALLRQDAMVRVDGLAESIRQIGQEGAAALHGGSLGERIVRGLESGGGILTMEDLVAYEAATRVPLRVAVDDWEVATTPAPSLGGTALAAMLLLLDGHPRDGWNDEELMRVIRAQEAVLRYAADLEHAVPGIDLAAEARELLAGARGHLRSALESPSTVHTSAVDSQGLACSITISSGYGSGALPGGTGIWMNNCLGEIELSPEGYHALPPGTRLRSNMAPTIARRGDGAVLAIGSPGASRITTAMLCTLLYDLRMELPLQEAVDAPRLHVVLDDEGYRVDYEVGLLVHRLGVRRRRFDRSMYFGGVAAVRLDPDGSFSVAADPRRSGSTALAGRRAALSRRAATGGSVDPTSE
ncbi:MAG: gamma-glutamyltransferase [Gemmatimonadota bacterium]|nr:MAG: gamma-glutamyltransferase [Gemmatimonadota bacterium]